ncbi:hypothetical protein GCM10022419_037040 [Nonomuraea rosea]|uniref:Uncharacterized protein n=1 Tax=Nonomuraea rosea TaxID=638574 RepID=A0ABP6WLA0_9ACTN
MQLGSSGFRLYHRQLSRTASAGLVGVMLLGLMASPSAAEPPAKSASAPIPAKLSAEPRPVVDPALKAASEKAQKTGQRVEVPSRFTETMKV